MKTLFQELMPGGGALQVADPELVSGVLKTYTTAEANRQCLENVNACVNGELEAFNKVHQGGFAGAFQTLRNPSTVAPPTPEPDPHTCPTGRCHHQPGGQVDRCL